MPLRAIAAVNVAAIERNVARLARELAPGCRVCAVVKAEGYGHGAVASARAAQAGGAGWLAVATAQEAVALRAAGVEGRLLVMGSLLGGDLDAALAAAADVVAWCEAFVDAVAARGGGRVHVKLDTGMGRLGTRDPEEATRVAQAAAVAPGVELAGAMTHFATADEREDTFFAAQLERFRAWALPLRELHQGLLVHAANSAAILRDRDAHLDMVRPGVGIYGLDPFGEDPALRQLEPALELRAAVAALRSIAAGESIGYGRRFVASEPTTIATLPVGYGDGWPRALTNNAEVLLAGERRPLVGTVSMDYVTVDTGPAPRVAVGDEAVLLGARRGERILAEEVARRMETINYEVTTSLLARVPRAHHRDGEPVSEKDATLLATEARSGAR
ncbi:MAG: alanine racemase [Solirubrobacteraceae bacterium MAG38_C4-C5]|nr:alanine racemase [Candidatus Siliceabacter maunaloa]